MTRAASADGLTQSEEAAASAGYLEKSGRPMYCLVFLLPLVVLYELGTRFWTTAAQNGQEQQIIAFSKMQAFFGLFGANGRHLPALAVVVVLLAWHIARNDHWRVDLGTLLGMAFESAVLCLPLFLIGFLVARYFPLMGSAPSSLSGASDPTRDLFIMSIGAGIYEEFVFRFVLFTCISLLLHDVLRMNRLGAYVVMVAASSLLFSLYHYWDTGEEFVTRIFAFRTLAGAYFGIVFLSRGFGITAASHSIYDAILAAL